MQTTTNYNLNIVEGTDVVNPLVQFNPNFTTIDGAMKANADASVSAATCIKSGTNHAVTRSNTDASVFKFTATGDWETGDTMTVDSTPVSVYTPNGTAPLTGAYVINTDVIASINGTRVVLYTANTKATSIDAIDVIYDNSVSGLTAVTCQGALDELRTSNNVLYDNTTSGLSANDAQSAIDELAECNKYVPVGGNYVAEAQSNGNVKITIPFYSPVSYAVASLSTTSNIGCAVYGTISSAAIFVDLNTIVIKDNRFVEITLTPRSGYTLSNYTQLGKGFLFEVPGLLCTLS